MSDWVDILALGMVNKNILTVKCSTYDHWYKYLNTIKYHWKKEIKYFIDCKSMKPDSSGNLVQQQ